MGQKRAVVTGMAVNTPLGDTLDAFLDGLLAGKSAVSRWKCFANEPVYSEVGADLSGYNVANRIAALEGKLPPEAFRRLRRLTRRVPWATQLSLLAAADVWLDAGLADAPANPGRLAVIVGGHNIGSAYCHQTGRQFLDEPDLIDGMYCLYNRDVQKPRK